MKIAMCLFGLFAPSGVEFPIPPWTTIPRPAISPRIEEAKEAPYSDTYTGRLSFLHRGKLLFDLPLQANLRGERGVPLSSLGPELSPELKWLERERLRAVLFHRPSVEPLRKRYLSPAKAGMYPSKPLVLDGRHFILVSAKKGGKVRIRIEALECSKHFPFAVYALFDPEGKMVALGRVPQGRKEAVSVKAEKEGIYTLLLNSGPARGNEARVTVLDLPWAILGAPVDYGGEPGPGPPFKYHWLRDFKLAGLNLVMLDVRYFPFSTDEELAEFKRIVGEWAKYARKFGIRFIPAIDLGGSDAEVEGWGDSPKGLYLKPKEERWKDVPIAPCPLSRVYWERIFLRRAKAVAEMSLENPYIVGIGLDPEMYSCWIYGHYMLSGTCFCDRCLGGFLKRKGLPLDILSERRTAEERLEWLRKEKLFSDYEKYLEDEMARIASWLREELHKINPDFLICVYVLEIGNWFCRGLARGFGTPRVPVINYAEGSYWPGYGAHVLRWMENFRNWGAYVLPACAIYPFVHPPFEAGDLPAHLYNLALRSGGYWLWPGSILFRESPRKPSFYGRLARLEDYWRAIRWANEEIVKRMKYGEGYRSPLESIKPHPTWHPDTRRFKPAPGFEWRTEPVYPLHLSGPCKLYFPVPPRTRRFAIYALTRGGKATVRLISPEGKVMAEAEVKWGREVPLKVEVRPPKRMSVWSLEVGGRAAADIALRSEGIPPFFSTAPSVLAPVMKKGDLIGWWRFDEGKGDIAHDSSIPPTFHGRIMGAKWVKGVAGKALWFDGKDDAVLIPHDWSMDNLEEFSLSAWVKLDSLPKRGEGRTIVNKGPEAPVQHFWWWIGYPPNYPLILEVGSEKHRWGTSFGSGKLEWALGRWYHVAVVFKCDGKTSTARLYRDGELIGASTKEEAFHSGEFDLSIGRYFGGMHPFHGSIDEVKFWSRALTDEEIKAEYEKGLAGRRPTGG